MRRFTIFSALFLAAVVSLPALGQDVITTAIGGGPNGIPALDANLYNPQGVAVDGSGNYYITSFNQHRVFKVTASTKVISVVAGSGAQGYSGDGVAGGAGNADLYHPFGVAVDSTGNVYIADQYNCVVRKVTTAGTITTIAGTAGACGYTGDSGVGTKATLYYPYGLAVDTLGNLYIGDGSNCVVRRVILSTDIISTYAGNHTCGYSGDTGAATAAELNLPTGLATDTAGNLYIADTSNCVVREVTKSSGKISTIAGDHTCGFSGDGGKATSAEINTFYGIAVNGGGTSVTIADSSNQRVRQFTVGGNINTVAGNGTACAGTCGEGGAATSAEFDSPYGVAESGGTIYVANNYNYAIDSFTVGGNLARAAGNHSYNLETLITGAPATGVSLNYPWEIADDTSGNVYIADSHNSMVREYVRSTGLVNFFAGTGAYGFTGDGGKATSADLTYPYGVAKDSSGNVYIGDINNCLVREVNTGGTISAFAGLVVSTSVRCGYSGDGGSATAAELYYPYGVAVDGKNSIYIADEAQDVVRRVTSGIITTIAGIGGINGYSGDGGPATNALLNAPAALTVDKGGNVFIADTNNCRVREINAATGIITTVAGDGNCSFTGDGLATSVGIGYPQGIAVDANDNLFIGDYNERVRWVSPSGVITTIAGTGSAGYNGDGGPATGALLYEPTGVALDPSGNVLVSDYNNSRIRSISVFPALNTSVGSLAFGLTSVGSTSSPQTITVSAYGPVTISNIQSTANYSEADNCPASMANGTTCTMYAYFVPTASGTLNGNISINDNGFFNQVDTVNLSGLGSAISLTGAPLAFGNETVKVKSAAQTVTVKNNGTSAITMGAITATNTTDYAISAHTCPASGATLAGGASCTISVTFDPQATGARRGSIVINDSDPSSPQLIGLSGTGVSKVALSPTAITFATTAVGVSSGAQKITLTNSTGASITLGATPLTFSGPFINNTGSTTCTADLVIASTGTCIISVEFHPTAVGFASGSVSVSDSDATTPQSVSLQGYGTGIKFTPGTVNFGTVTRGIQVSSTATITNVGLTPVFFTGAEISGTSSADFSDNYSDSPPCGNSSSSPLLPGKTCQITVYFLPSKVGGESASYRVFDNSVGSPQSLSLTGTGQ
jgi:sugar lactone lactonase YvrE